MGGVGGAEIGPVAAEGLDPLLPGVVEVLGDQVRDVAPSSAGHRDVRRRGAGVFADQEVGLVDRLALGAVDRAGIGELHMLADVTRRKAASTGLALHPEPTAQADGGDGPAVTVGHIEIRLVPARGDPVPDTDTFPGAGHRRPHRGCCLCRGAALYPLTPPAPGTREAASDVRRQPSRTLKTQVGRPKAAVLLPTFVACVPTTSKGSNHGVGWAHGFRSPSTSGQRPSAKVEAKLTGTLHQWPFSSTFAA